MVNALSAAAHAPRPPPKVLVRDFVDRSKAYVIDTVESGSKTEAVTGSVDEAQVLGFGCWMQTSLGKTLVAYFAGTRASERSSPDYEQQLWFMINGTIFDLTCREASIDLSQSFGARTVKVTQKSEKTGVFSYKYPFFRGLANKIFGDPLLAKRDLVEVAVDLARSFSEQKS